MIEPFDRPFNEGSPTQTKSVAETRNANRSRPWKTGGSCLMIWSASIFGAAKLTHSRIHRRDNGGEPRLLLHSHPDAPEPALVLELSDETQAVTWCELLHCIA